MLDTPKAAKPTPSRINDDPALRIKEAPDYLHVHTKTVRRMVAAKKLKTVQLTATIKGIRRSELERFMGGEGR